jgi:glutathione S-transferase
MVRLLRSLAEALDQTNLLSFVHTQIDAPAMQLYVTAALPYARIARIVLNEKGLRDRVQILMARTRTRSSPYYEINPSGRVPYLVRDDGVGMEDSDLIAAYLDHIDGKPTLYLPPWHDNWEYGRLEAGARSLLDGLAVLVREIRRPENERSPGIIEIHGPGAGGPGIVS